MKKYTGRRFLSDRIKEDLKDQECRKAFNEFEVEIPNEITEQAMKDTEEKQNLVHCKDAKDMFKKLGI